MTDIDVIDNLHEAEDETPARSMTDTEQALATHIYDAIQDFSRSSTRGRQAAEYRAGISDLGFCSERLRRMLAQDDPDDTDLLAAFIGSAIGDHVEQAIKTHWPDAILQASVVTDLYGETNHYRVPGHPDVILPTHGILLDGKTDRGLGIVRRTGPSQQQQFQRHCYAKGAYEAGLFNPELNLEDIQVANVWLDRAADEHELYVHLEPYSDDVVREAAWWLDEVVYAYTHGQTARKEPPYEMCAKTCGFFRDCRLGEGNVSGLLTDPTVLAAVDMYTEGLDLQRQGKQLKDQAKAHLDGIAGSTGEYTVKWTHVNGAPVNYVRRPYDKLDIRRVK